MKWFSSKTKAFKVLPLVLFFAGLFAFTNADANVTIYNDTDCKYEVEIVFGPGTCGPSLASTIVVVPPNSTIVVVCPPGLTMYKAGATEAVSGQSCAVYDPACGGPDICGKFGKCKAFFGVSSPTLLKFAH